MPSSLSAAALLSVLKPLAGASKPAASKQDPVSLLDKALEGKRARDEAAARRAAKKAKESKEDEEEGLAGEVGDDAAVLVRAQSKSTAERRRHSGSAPA